MSAPPIINSSVPDHIVEQILLDNKALIDSEMALCTNKRKFRLYLAPEAQRAVSEALRLPVSSFVEAQVAKGDSAPHIDRDLIGGNAFNYTHILYLTDSEGQLLLDSEQCPITKGRGYIFGTGLSHGTVGTGTQPRLTIGPINEHLVPVGTPPIVYYASLEDATANTYLGYSDGYVIGANIVNGSIGSYTHWRIYNAYGVDASPSGTTYTNGDTLYHTDGYSHSYFIYAVDGGMSGDPQVRTLSGQVYTVPDYLSRFNYLKACASTSGQKLSIDCTTRVLEAEDFPKGLWDYVDGDFVCVGDFDKGRCPHTYLDQLTISIGETKCTIDCDSLEVTGETGSLVLSTQRPTRGLPSILKGPYALRTQTKYLKVEIIGFGTLELWSDRDLMERHGLSLSLSKDVTPLSGAVVDIPISTFECIPDPDPVSRTDDTVTINIGGRMCEYTINTEHDKDHLLQFLNTHKLILKAPQ